MAIDYLDGRRYGRAVIAGAEWVLHTREALNRINVFPVPDGDTGTNMALSLSATAGAVRDLDDRHLGNVSRKVAEASILGAKGNSGLILAHWFLGVCRGIDGRSRVDGRQLAQAMAVGTRSVYEALERPVEGTILTVMRAASDGAREIASRGADLGVLLDRVIAVAEEALARTPHMLEVLGKANVVDAGAAGYVNFMKGVRRAIRGEPAPRYSEEEMHASATHPEEPGDETLTERFCTEVVCRGRGFDTARLRRMFSRHGTYLLVAATTEVFKLHIHTNHPEEVLRKAERLGTIEERKVDDMLRQREERSGERRRGIRPEDQPGTVAIVCDSTADLPTEVWERNGITMVPLQVLFPGRVFRDRIDLAPSEFYRRLRNGERPTTSQPPPREFVEALEGIRPDREVIVLTLSARLSGTHRSARSGVALAAQSRVEVVDSGSASLGLGLQALCAARLAARGAPADRIVEWIGRWREGTGVVFTVATLEFLRRGGRIGAAQGLLGTLLGIRPVLVCTRGEIVPVAKTRGDEEAFEGVIREVRRCVPRDSRLRLGLVEAGRAGVIGRAEERLRELFDVVDVVRGEFTGVVGAHTGPGTWGVAYQVVPEDDPLC